MWYLHFQEPGIKQIENANYMAIEFINEGLYEKALQQLTESEQLLEKLAHTSEVNRLYVMATMYNKAAAYQK